MHQKQLHSSRRFEMLFSDTNWCSWVELLHTHWEVRGINVLRVGSLQTQWTPDSFFSSSGMVISVHTLLHFSIARVLCCWVRQECKPLDFEFLQTSDHKRLHTHLSLSFCLFFPPFPPWIDLGQITSEHSTIIQQLPTGKGDG